LRKIPIILAAVLLSAPASAQSDASIADFIASFDKAIKAIKAEAPDGGARTREKCKALLERVLDLDAITRHAAGEKTWSGMTPAQRTGFRAGIDARVSAECAKSVKQSRGETAVLLGVLNTDNGEKLATTRLPLANGSDKTVAWRLRSGGPRGWRAVDVVTDGRSAAAGLHNEYANFLQARNGDVDALIEHMQQ
jgi:ABC-type transporter MlaC component